MKLKGFMLMVLAGFICFQMAFAGLSYAVGAIAYSEGDDTYGLVTGYPNKDKAFAEAKKVCQEHGGKQCKGMVWFKKCGALALSDSHWGYGYGDTKASAESQAKSACKGKCKIAVSDCEKK